MEIRYLKQEVAEKEAQECANKYGGVWCVVAYKFDFDVVKQSSLRRSDKVVSEKC
jgi:hypothetical protein